MQAVKRASLSFVRMFDSWAGTENDQVLEGLRAAKMKQRAAALKEGAAAAKENARAAIMAALGAAAEKTSSARAQAATAAANARAQAATAAASAKAQATANAKAAIDWGRVVPFILLHLSVLFVFVVGFSWVAFLTAVALYVVRMFAITAGYHRYFSHRAYRTSRAGQFCLAVLGASAAQRGPLWWAAHHRHHHEYSDQPEDIHSPTQKGLIWSHIGWVLDRTNFRSRVERVKDFARYPELRFLDRFDILVPVLLGVSMFLFGVALEHWAPGLGTNGWQMLVWGFIVSTIALYHGTFTVNSLTHVFGRRRFATKDTSRNSFLIAMITLGEGWHNNHHHYPASARQGFYWWEIDFSYYVLKFLSLFGIVWDIRPVPERALNARRIRPTQS